MSSVVETSLIIKGEGGLRFLDALRFAWNDRKRFLNRAKQHWLDRVSPYQSRNTGLQPVRPAELHSAATQCEGQDDN